MHFKELLSTDSSTRKGFTQPVDKANSFRVLFLCMELPGYFVNCIQMLYESTQGSITVIFWPNSDSAPFENHLPGIRLMNRQSLNRLQLDAYCMKFKPAVVFVGGWIDKDYKHVCKKLKQAGSKVLCALDNAWEASLRQRTAAFMSRWLIMPYYSCMWAAGLRQYQFARKLGYDPENILMGLYAADVDKFAKHINENSKPYLVYAGRFEPEKGVDILYEVFASLKDEERNGWKLQMIGNGSLKNKMPATKDIEIFDFMQPNDLAHFIIDAGCFILPSLYEPWGVVVQEFAAGGKPLLLSSAVNSGELYLIHQYNGFVFQSGNKPALKETLVKFFHLNTEAQMVMGKRSTELAQNGHPKQWVGKLLSVVSLSS